MGEITIYTDGSSLNNKNYNSPAGIGVFFGDDDERNISLRIVGTNQYAELYAIYMALNTIKNDNYDKITICTDSMYSINCLKVWIKNWKLNNWQTSTGKPVKHSSLIKNIDELLHDKICFKHIRSHKKAPSKDSPNWCDWYGNDCADKLSKYFL